MRDEIWAKMSKILEDHPLPSVICKGWLSVAAERGLLMKVDLKDGHYYLGRSRNASVARWDAARERFTYMRVKFLSVYPEDICHPEDDDGYDLFFPLKEVTPTEKQIIKN